MGRARVVVSDSIVASGGLDKVEHCLELADDEHVAVDVEKVLLGEVLLFKFLLDGLVIGHDRNLRECNLGLGLLVEDFVRIDVK